MAGQHFDTPSISDTPLLHFLMHHTALAGRPGAGPALALSLVLVAIVCVFTGLCYAELASMIPIAGSAYTYTYATLGELTAWIIGWDLILEYAIQQHERQRGLCRPHCRSAGLVRAPSRLAMDFTGLFAHGFAGLCGQQSLQSRLAFRLQPSRVPGGHDPHRAFGTRHSRVGPHQQHPGADQDRGDSSVRVYRGQLREAAPLAPLYAEWLDGSADRRLDYLLHLHRVRLGLDSGRGVQESAARRAVRHYGDAGCLHTAVWRGGDCA